MATFIAQSRRNADSNWRHVASGYATAKETAKAQALNDEMQRAGFRYSELHAHRDDLVAGHVLTADNGTQFRILEREDESTDALLDRVEAENADVLPMVKGCTFGQWLEPANAVAQQAEALRTMKIPHGQRHAAVARLVENAKTLAAWTADDRR